MTLPGRTLAAKQDILKCNELKYSQKSWAFRCILKDVSDPGAQPWHCDSLHRCRNNSRVFGLRPSVRLWWENQMTSTGCLRHDICVCLFPQGFRNVIVLQEMTHKAWKGLNSYNDVTMKKPAVIVYQGWAIVKTSQHTTCIHYIHSASQYKGLLTKY